MLSCRVVMGVRYGAGLMKQAPALCMHDIVEYVHSERRIRALDGVPCHHAFIVRAENEFEKKIRPSLINSNGTHLYG